MWATTMPSSNNNNNEDPLLPTTSNDNDDGQPYLPGYEAQIHESGVEHSIRKLDKAHDALVPLLEERILRQRPCVTEADTLGYRCCCTFQLVKNETSFAYAMRQRNQPVLLRSDVFPIANSSIQSVMKLLLQWLNDESSDDLACVRSNLTSVSFATNWRDHYDSCLVTLHYSQPFDPTRWTAKAQRLCDELQCAKLTGRSKGRVVSVCNSQWETSDNGYLVDRLCLYRDRQGRLSVGLLDDESALAATIRDYVELRYLKPETAFFHPNANVMLQALQWMISRVECIVVQEEYNESSLVRLLEMYCGCGAHTVALASTGLLDLVVAVELDERLVKACKENCRINSCILRSRTAVHVHQGDAGAWAQRSRKQLSVMTQVQQTNNALDEESPTASWYTEDYDILLVDPPRMGLDEKVCQMAIEGPFRHLLYISCGQGALQRDLERLKSHFIALDCTLLDLFPRTSSVEALVHLKRYSVD